MESILITIKKLLGIAEEDNSFDLDIITIINTVLPVLTQLGVGPATGYSITDESDLWEDFIGTDQRLGIVKSYVFLNTKLIFDPPSSSTVMQSIKDTVAELTWRIDASVRQAEEEIQND